MPIKLADMSLDNKDREDMGMALAANQSKYPYGLCISLTQHELEKMDADHADWDVGDVFDLRAMARVTSISENETEGGKSCRVELQIVMLGAESEDEPPVSPKSRIARLYKE